MEKTIVLRNPEVIKEEFRDNNIVDVWQAYESLVARFFVYYKGQFSLLSLHYGQLVDENKELTIEIQYLKHRDVSDELVIVIYNDFGFREIESVRWYWHNLIVDE